MTARFAVLALALLGTAASAAEQSLLEAAEAGDRAAALAALKAGDDVDARAADGTTALIWAAYNGDAELAERLIAAGADARREERIRRLGTVGGRDRRLYGRHRGVARARRRAPTWRIPRARRR